ncbi:MAG: hypothetical protein H8E87_07450, partial [FCB group bacterium]|nr:hypothetical protein [FCB group bacterium]
MKILKFSYLFSAACCLILSPLISTAQQWRSYTPMNNPHDIEYYNGAIWGATDGGIFRFDIEDSTYKLISRADGLLGQEFHCLAVETRILNGDSTVNIWSSGWGAELNIYNTETGVITALTDLNGFADKVEDIAIGEGYIFAASDKGVSQLYYHEEYGEYLFKGTYSQWGYGGLSENVRCALVHDGWLWIGLDDGVARAPLSAPNLVMPNAWETYTTADGLPGNNINGFAVVNDTVWAATYNSGLARFEGDHFTPVLAIQWIKEMRAFDDTLYAAVLGGVKRFVNNNWQSFSAGSVEYNCICRDADGVFWAGKANKWNQYGGLQGRVIDIWLDYPVNAPAAKRISGMIFDEQGRLWCAATSAVGKGVFIYDYFDWLNFTGQLPQYANYFYTLGGTGAGPQTLLEHPNGEILAGSFGTGLAIFTASGEQHYFNYEDSLSYGNISRLAGIDADQDFVVIGEMALDDDNNVWLLNREASSDEPLVVIPADFMMDHSANIPWTYYSVSDLGSGDSRLDYLVRDHMG